METLKITQWLSIDYMPILMKSVYLLKVDIIRKPTPLLCRQIELFHKVWEKRTCHYPQHYHVIVPSTIFDLFRLFTFSLTPYRTFLIVLNPKDLAIPTTASERFR